MQDTKILFGVDTRTTQSARFCDLIKSRTYKVDMDQKSVWIDDEKTRLYEASDEGLEMILPSFNKTDYIVQFRQVYGPNLLHLTDSSGMLFLATFVHYVPTWLIITKEKVYFFFDDPVDSHEFVSFERIVDGLCEGDFDGVTSLTRFNDEMSEPYIYDSDDELIGIDRKDEQVVDHDKSLQQHCEELERILTKEYSAKKYVLEIKDLEFVIRFEIPDEQFCQIPLIYQAFYLAKDDTTHYTCEITLPRVDMVLASCLFNFQVTSTRCMSCDLVKDKKFVKVSDSIRCWLCQECEKKVEKTNAKKTKKRKNETDGSKTIKRTKATGGKTIPEIINLD